MRVAAAAAKLLLVRFALSDENTAPVGFLNANHLDMTAL